MRYRLIQNVFIYFFLTVILLLTLFPILYTFSASLKSNIEIMTEPDKLIPSSITLDNYKNGWLSDEFQII